MAYTTINDAGTKYWHNAGGQIQHDNDLPAVERENKGWFVNGEQYRINDLPSIKYGNGNKALVIDKKLHRNNGLPASEFADGHKE
jgi:hypothetical protein